MPGADGLQMARSIKAQSPVTPIVLMTGWGADSKDKWDLGCDVDAVVGKPLSMAELNRLLQNLTQSTSQPVASPVGG
jgi:DNA-binding response OmpR family regulator